MPQPQDPRLRPIQRDPRLFDPRLRPIEREIDDEIIDEEDPSFMDQVLRATDIAFTTPELVSKAFDVVRRVPEPIRRNLMPFGTGSDIGLDITESLSTPGDIALLAGTGGTGLIPRAGRGLQKIAGGLLATRGGERAITAESPVEFATGAAEILGGAFGMRTPVSRATKSISPKVAAESTENMAKQIDLPLQDPRSKLKSAIDEAYPLRGEQEKLYTLERGERVAKAKGVTTPGEVGAYERLGKLRGEYEKVPGRTISTKLEQTDIDSLFNDITAAPIGDEFIKMHGRTGLIKLLQGDIPQNNELKVLAKIFGSDYVNKLAGRMKLADRKQNLISEAVNLPRSVMASYDFSAPLRQGLPLIHKKAFYTSFDDMFRAWSSEKSFRAIQNSIEDAPEYGLALESKLQLTDLADLASREEQFMSTWAEKIPGVRRSNRAYVAFLNKLRFDTFKSLTNNAKKMGLDPEKDLTLARNFAEFINTSTGRGSLGKLERHAVLLNSGLFAPRLIASRLKMLNPRYYQKLDPMTRKEALKSLFAAAGAGSTIASLAQLSGVGDVDPNPTSSDFGKIRIGNTRIDPYAGFQQYIVAASKLISGQSTSTISGRKTDLTAGEFGRPTRLDILQQSAESKLHPVVSFAVDMLRGRDFTGQPINIPEATIRRMLPIIVQDVFELAMEDPELLPLTIPAAFGMGLQTYQRR